MKLLKVASALTTVGALAMLTACSSSSSGGGDAGSSSSSGSSSGSSSSGSGSGSSSGGATGTPSVAITAPAAAAAVTVTPPDDNVPISFTVTNFDLEPAGMCPAATAMSDNCGHLHLLVDGASCTPAGAPYNNATAGPPQSPIDAILSTCPMVNGAHTVTLEMHHDNHAPINDASGKVISASVMITASGG